MEECNTVVIGAGQAGLSASYYLNKSNIDHLVLDKRERIGNQWRERWDSLKLFTPAKYNQLPGKEFPGDPWSFAHKDVVADYLEEYAKDFELPVRLGTGVDGVFREKDGFLVDAGDNGWKVEHVIVATGAFQRPYIPSCRGKLLGEMPQWHSSEYNNPDELPDGNVLVVGTGNSGIQIAEELSSTHTVHLSGRENTHFPRTFLTKDIYWWFDLLGILSAGRDSWFGNKLYEKASSGGDPLIGASLDKRCREHGITRHPKVADAEGQRIIFQDGSSMDTMSSIVWATGFRPDFRWIDADIFREDGYPKHERGVVEDVPGLYFLGLRWLHRGDSSLLGGVGRDAKYIIRHLEQRTSG